MLLFLDQSDSFFHCQCLECPAMDDQPCRGQVCGEWVFVNQRCAVKVFIVIGQGRAEWGICRGSWPGSGPAGGDPVLSWVMLQKGT